MSYFRRLGPDRLGPTERTAGAWSETEQHLAPTVGLCVHELERRLPSELMLGRLSLDVLGTMAIAPVDVEVHVLRPGRTIELSEVVLTQEGRAVIRARAWRLAHHDSAEAAGGAPAALPGPDTATPWAMSEVWRGDFIAALDVRTVTPPQPGRATTWVSTSVPLVADEPVSDLARWCGLVDTANGIAVRCSPREWMFPNVDLTLHLHRTPSGPWLGLDTRVVLGADGLGVTSSVLHDVDGAVGRSEQVLTVRRLPG